MKLLGVIVVASLVLAGLKAAVAVLIVLLAVGLLYGMLFRPAETIAFVALSATLSFVQARPGLSILLVLSVTLACLLMRDGQRR